MKRPIRSVVIAIWLAALAMALPLRLDAQCVVQNPSFETVTVGSLNTPGYWITPSVETAISGCPGWYTRFYSPDIFWPSSHVPFNFMTAAWAPKWPWHGSNYAGISNGNFGTFHSEILAGTLTSSPTGNWYEVRGRFAMAAGRNKPSFVRVSLDNGLSTPRYVVGHMLVNDTSWKLFSQFINLPTTPTYNRIVIEGVDSIHPGAGAYFFVDSVDICRKDPCDLINARFRKQPSGGSGSCCYDLIVDNTIPAGMPQPIGIRVTIDAPSQLNGITWSSGWSTLGSTSGPVGSETWGASPFWGPLPTGTGMHAGTFCVVPNGVTPQRHIIEYLGQNLVTLCRDTIYTDCEAETPRCLEAFEESVRCDVVDASGNQTYKINFTVSPTPSGTFPTGANLRISSPQGTFSPWIFPLTGSSTLIGPITFTDTPPADTQVCIYLEYYITQNRKDTLLCRDTLCMPLPTCPKGCCTNFTRQILQPRISYVNGTVDLSACVLAGPGLIKRFSATIVSAQTRQRCGLSAASPWARAFGDIISGTLSSTLPGPTWVSGTAYSRETVWGGSSAISCVSFNPCVPLRLRMVFPNPPTSRLCHDTLVFAIRYSFTDCDCRTCDTVINYRIVRRYTPIIWDPHWPGDPGSASTPDAVILKGNPGLIRIDMSSANDAELSITLPQADQNAPAIEITGMTFRPVGVALFDMTAQGSQQSETIEGNAASPALSLQGGQSTIYDIEYSNGEQEPLIRNIVRFRYVLVSDPQTEYETDDILVEARIPAASGGDDVGEESQPPVSGVRTYVLHVDADNNADAAVNAIRVKVSGNSRLIAVGPVGEGTDVVLTPGTDADGNSVVQIDRSAWETQAIDAATSLMPIYLTFSNAASGVSVDYETINENGAVLTGGSVQLGSPLQAAGVGSDVAEQESALWPVYPNPAGTSATVGFRLHEGGEVRLSVRDLQGREVVTSIAGEQMQPGDHVMAVKTDGLAQGTYIVVLNVDGRTYTRTLSVMR